MANDEQPVHVEKERTDMSQLPVKNGSTHVVPPSRFKFIASDGIGASAKRSQVQKACDSCRRRKKRCLHTASARRSPFVNVTGVHESQSNLQSASASIISSGNVPQLDTPDQGLQIRDEQSAAPQAPLQEGQNSRFIGHLSPEGIFLEATSPDEVRTSSSDSSIGIWLNSALKRTASLDTQDTSQISASIFHGSGSLVQKVLVPMLEQECLSCLPPTDSLVVLSNIYMERIHPIFPVIDFNTHKNLSSLDPSHILLQQAICLAASKSPMARPHLILPESPTARACRDFGNKISAAMRLSIEIGLVKDKIVIIQALALMSQFVDNPVGEDLTAQFCSIAIHHIHSLGLHIKPQREERVDQKNDILFCAVWAIDRMNAAVNGRPVTMHERDLSKSLDLCLEQQAPCFRLFLEVISLLDKVIQLYRPASTEIEPASAIWDIPSFEDIVLKCGANSIGASALTTIELLYHAVAILSCRTKSWDDPLRSSMSYLRQSLSTSIVCSTVSKDFQEQITLFPFIPYAMSLSMSIAYREMRHSKLPSHRARSRAQFQTICDALSELDGTFWSASTTSEMGKKLLKEMDRVFLTMSASEKRSYHNSSSGSRIEEAEASAPGSAPNGTHTDQTSMTDFSIQSSNNITQEFNPALFDSISDFDLFGMFDPAFDLDGFDACLEGNLNPAFPTNFQ